jgi:hypothetical protein
MYDNRNKQSGGVGIAILIVVGVIVGGMVLTVLGTAFNLITIPWLKFERKVELNRDIVNKTYETENALYNYRWFKDREEAIKAQKKKIEIAKQAHAEFQTSAGPRDKWTFEDKTEDARLRAIVQGNQSAYEEMVGEYNSRAKQVDRAIFKDDLPLFISIE